MVIMRGWLLNIGRGVVVRVGSVYTLYIYFVWRWEWKMDGIRTGDSLVCYLARILKNGYLGGIGRNGSHGTGLDGIDKMVGVGRRQVLVVLDFAVLYCIVLYLRLR